MNKILKLMGLFLREYYQPLIVSLLMLITASYFSTQHFDPHHDGILFKPAVDVAEGKILFKETFTQYGALTTLLQALAINIFGEYLIVIRLLTAFFYSLIGFFMWLVWSKIIPRWLTTISCIIWLFLPAYYLHYWENKYAWPFLPWSSVYALFFLIISCYLMIVYLEKNRPVLLFAAGITTGLAFWCKQPVGVFLLFSMVCFLAILDLLARRKNVILTLKNILIYMSGAAAISLLFFVWLIASGALKDWWLQSIAFAYNFAKKGSFGHGLNIIKILKNLFTISPQNQNVSYIWIIMPVVCLILFVYIIAYWLYAYIKKEGKSSGGVNPSYKSKKNIRKKSLAKSNEIDRISINKETLIAIAILFACFASWMQYYPVPCTRHVYWSASPMVGIFSYFVWKILRFEDMRNKIIVALIIISLFFGYDIKIRLEQGLEKFNMEYVTINYPAVLSGMRLTKDQADFAVNIARTIDNYLEVHPGCNVICIGKDPFYLTFQKNNKNFHPIYVYWEGIINELYPGYYDAFDDYVGKNKPLIISDGISIPGYTVIGNYNWVYSKVLILAPE